MSVRLIASRAWVCVVLLACSAVPVVAGAADADAGTAVQALQQSLMTHAMVLRGSIDGRQVQLSLQPKKNEDGLEGRYFYFGESTQILLAGEVEGDNLVMEESINGKDVSGQWEGHRDGSAITGTWSSADGSVNKPFLLQLP